MSLTLQITIYMASIAAMLTFMKMISGLTGSQKIRMGVMRTATISAGFLFVSGLVKISLNFNWLMQLVSKDISAAKTASTMFFLVWILFVFYFFGLGVIVRLYVRTLRFKDWGTFRNLKVIPPFSWVKQVWRWGRGDKREYETSRVATSREPKVGELWRSLIGSERPNSYPALLATDDPWALRRKVVRYLADLARQPGEEINYVCCNVSPDNIWNLMKNELGHEISQLLKNRLVFVDAYTTTFGFDDEILPERVRKLKTHEMVDVVSCHSSAGVHSGTALAFKMLKKKAEKEKRTRHTCTVIYDSLSVLAIPETDNEVSEFVIHLTAAELTYDMQTIFLEADVENRKSPVLDVMKACCGTPIKVVDDED